MAVDVKALLLKRIDIEGLVVEDVLRGLLKPLLEAKVASTANPYDNMVLNLAYPLIEDAVGKFIADLKAAA